MNATHSRALRYFLVTAALTLCVIIRPVLADDSSLMRDLTKSLGIYVTCIQAQTVMLDDGVSDAKTIGNAAVEACKPLLAATSTWFTSLPKLTSDERQKADAFYVGLEGHMRESSATTNRVLSNRTRTRGLKRAEVDGIWLAFRGYFACLEEGFNRLDHEVEDFVDVMVIAESINQKLCNDRYQADRDSFVARHPAWKSAQLVAFLEEIPDIAAIDAALDRIAKRPIAIP